MLFSPEMLVPSGPPPQAILDQRWGKGQSYRPPALHLKFKSDKPAISMQCGAATYSNPPQGEIQKEMQHYRAVAISTCVPRVLEP
eukprot:4363928-Amphidinium_carterae.1